MVQSPPEFEEQAPHEKGFAAYFKTHIAPLLEGLEAERRKKFKKQKILMGLLWAIAIGLIAQDFFIDFELDGVDNLYIGLIAAVFVFFISWKPFFAFSGHMKEQVLPLLLSFFGEGFVYKQAGGLNMGHIMPSGIVPPHDRYRHEDYIKGHYKGVAIEACEMELIDIHTYRDSKGRTRRRRTCVFKGLVVLADMHKTFKGHTIVRRNISNILTLIGAFFREKFSGLSKSVYEKINLEDPRFESKFNVYSNDQVEARYIMTTSFMERLMRTSDIFGKSALECAFFDQKVLVMIPHKKPLFEAGSVFRSVYDYRNLRLSLQQLHQLFSIIDTLKLNQKIGL